MMIQAVQQVTQPADWGGLLLVILGVFALFGTWFVSRAYKRNGAVQAALDTVNLLSTKVDLLEKENTHLKVTLEVLREQVTQAAAVKTLIDYVMVLADDRNRDAKAALDMLGRIERKLDGSANG